MNKLLVGRWDQTTNQSSLPIAASFSQWKHNRNQYKRILKEINTLRLKLKETKAKPYYASKIVVNIKASKKQDIDTPGAKVRYSVEITLKKIVSSNTFSSFYEGTKHTYTYNPETKKLSSIGNKIGRGQIENYDFVLKKIEEIVAQPLQK
jgi:RNAse (barnase) inhibitor barstar